MNRIRAKVKIKHWKSIWSPSNLGTSFLQIGENDMLELRNASSRGKFRCERAAFCDIENPREKHPLDRKRMERKRAYFNKEISENIIFGEESFFEKGEYCES